MVTVNNRPSLDQCSQRQRKTGEDESWVQLEAEHCAWYLLGINNQPDGPVFPERLGAPGGVKCVIDTWGYMWWPGANTKQSYAIVTLVLLAQIVPSMIMTPASPAPLTEKDGMSISRNCTFCIHYPHMYLDGCPIGKLCTNFSGWIRVSWLEESPKEGCVVQWSQ